MSETLFEVRLWEIYLRAAWLLSPAPVRVSARAGALDAAQGCKVITNNRKPGSSVQAHDGKIVKLNAEDIAKSAK
jgi:hypothetical protein